MKIETLKRKALGISLIAMPFLLFAGFVLHPHLFKMEPLETVEQLVGRFHNNPLYHYGHLIVTFAVPVIMIVSLGIMALLKSKGKAFGFWGGIITMFGAFILAVDKGALCLVLSAFDTLPENEFQQFVPFLKVIVNKEKFWSIIEEVKTDSNGNNRKLTGNFKKRLNCLSNKDLLHFQFIYEIYETAVISAPSNLIWTALFLMNGGVYSNTYNFAGWLIIQGKDIYMNALLNADTLAEAYTPENTYEYNRLRFLAAELYKEKTKLKIRAFQKIEHEFWEKQEIKQEATEIKNEITYSTVKRDRNWKISDLEMILPNLYKKSIEKEIASNKNK